MIDLIDGNIRLIEEIRSQGYESFSNIFRDIQATKHALQESIEACLDMGSHIIAEKGLHGIIEGGLAKRFNQPMNI